MQKIIPNFFREKLIKNYGEEIVKNIFNNFSLDRKVTLRVNTLKSNINEIKEKLKYEKIKHKDIKWNENALIIENEKEDKIKSLEMYQNGEIYLQSLSSMLPSIVLAPKEGENILDMAAAPRRKDYTNGCNI